MTTLFIFPFTYFKINLCSCGCVYLILGFTLLGHTIYGYTSLIKMSNQAKWDPTHLPIVGRMLPFGSIHVILFFSSPSFSSSLLLLLQVKSQENPKFFFFLGFPSTRLLGEVKIIILHHL